MRARRFAMMTDEQKSKAAELKSVIGTATTGDGAPREVRVAAVSLKRELRQMGTTARELAGLLGVHESTLCRWERDVGGDLVVATRGKRRDRSTPKRRDRATRFRMVEMATATMTPAAPTTAGMSSMELGARGLRVAHAPSGLVVDGLDIETLAALLRRMS
jgi:hypothetical protein